jgi:hypothetical protein
VTAWLVAILLVAYLAAPVVELRLWRAGRLSDRAVTALLLARFPVLFGVMWLASGAHLETLAIVVLGVIIVWKLFYGWLLSAVRDKRAELDSARS